MKRASLAIDVGATKVAVGLVTREGEVLARVDISSKVLTLDDLNSSLDVAITEVLETSVELETVSTTQKWILDLILKLTHALIPRLILDLIPRLILDLTQRRILDSTLVQRHAI